jgi:hypothetical protein
MSNILFVKIETNDSDINLIYFIILISLSFVSKLTIIPLIIKTLFVIFLKDDAR